MIFEADHYYRLSSRRIELPIADSPKKQFMLYRGDLVICIGIDVTKGKRYAVLWHQDENEQQVGLLHRVSRWNRGAGEWTELNPMVVIALSDKLPTI